VDEVNNTAEVKRVQRRRRVLPFMRRSTTIQETAQSCIGGCKRQQQLHLLLIVHWRIHVQEGVLPQETFDDDLQ